MRWIYNRYQRREEIICDEYISRGWSKALAAVIQRVGEAWPNAVATGKALGSYSERGQQFILVSPDCLEQTHSSRNAQPQCMCAVICGEATYEEAKVCAAASRP